MNDLDLPHVLAARRRIGAILPPTPLKPSPGLSAATGAEVRLKLETLQPTGSFKIRGATHAVARLDAEQRKAGVVTASTGNHGRALAHAARAAGVPVTVCLSNLVPGNKVQAVRELGAEVCIIGKSQDEAQVEAERLQREAGMTLIPPFDHADVVAGQGTLGLELLDQWAELDGVIVPVSGGGLISGVALALKLQRPSIKVIGVTITEGAAMWESLKAGKPVAVPETESLADSLGGGIGLDNRYTFEVVRRWVDDVIQVPEAVIAKGMRGLFFDDHWVTEGAAAIGAGALLAGLVKPARDSRWAVVVSGHNVDMQQFLKVMQG